MFSFISCKSILDENFPENEKYQKGENANKLHFHSIHFDSSDNKVGIALVVRSGVMDELSTADVATQTASLLVEWLKTYLKEKNITDVSAYAEVGMEYTIFTVIIPAMEDPNMLKYSIRGMAALLNNKIFSDIENNPSKYNTIVNKNEDLPINLYDDEIFPLLVYKSAFSRYGVRDKKQAQLSDFQEFHQLTYGPGISDLIVMNNIPAKKLRNLTRKSLGKVGSGNSLTMRRPYVISGHAKTLYDIDNAEEISAPRQVYFMKKDFDQFITVPRMKLYSRNLTAMLVDNILIQRNATSAASSTGGLVLEHAYRIPFTLGTTLNIITANLPASSETVTPKALSAMLEKEININEEEWKAGYSAMRKYLYADREDYTIQEYLDVVTHAILYNMPVLTKKQYQQVHYTILDTIEKEGVENWIKQFVSQENRVVAVRSTDNTPDSSSD